jgi:PHD/YefM family antitoxin component YafN of YafNO toxin-antitoxin module
MASTRPKCAGTYVNYAGKDLEEVPELESDSDSNSDAQSDSEEVVGASEKQHSKRECKHKVVSDGEDGDIQPKRANRGRKAFLNALESNKNGRKQRSKKSVGATKITASKKGYSSATNIPLISLNSAISNRSQQLPKTISFTPTNKDSYTSRFQANLKDLKLKVRVEVEPLVILPTVQQEEAEIQDGRDYKHRVIARTVTRNLSIDQKLPPSRYFGQAAIIRQEVKSYILHVQRKMHRSRMSYVGMTGVELTAPPDALGGTKSPIVPLPPPGTGERLTPRPSNDPILERRSKLEREQIF